MGNERPQQESTRIQPGGATTRQKKEEKMQKPPQIIVIPQSMLAGQKSLLRLAPMPRNTSPLLSSTASPSPLLSSASVSPLLSSSPRPVAAVVGSKRPAPSPSPPKDLLLDIKEEQKEDEAPARKRANLDHLSPEERMMRRKLKNRVAAQTARDKKKAATDSMEQQLAEAKARLQESLEANALLIKTNTQLQVENANLQQKNNELQARLSPLCPLPLSPPASPLPSPASSPNTPLSTVLSPPETAVLTYVPQQQEQGKSTMQQASRSSDPGLSSKDLTPWGRAPALTVVCAALLALSPKHSPPHPSPSPSPSPPLPLKKRPTPQ